MKFQNQNRDNDTETVSEFSFEEESQQGDQPTRRIRSLEEISEPESLTETSSEFSFEEDSQQGDLNRRSANPATSFRKNTAQDDLEDLFDILKSENVLPEEITRKNFHLLDAQEISNYVGDAQANAKEHPLVVKEIEKLSIPVIEAKVQQYQASINSGVRVEPKEDSPESPTSPENQKPKSRAANYDKIREEQRSKVATKNQKQKEEGKSARGSALGKIASIPFVAAKELVVGYVFDLPRGVANTLGGSLQAAAGYLTGNDQLKEEGQTRTKAGLHMATQGATGFIRAPVSLLKEASIGIVTGENATDTFRDKQKATQIQLAKASGKEKKYSTKNDEVTFKNIRSGQKALIAEKNKNKTIGDRLITAAVGIPKLAIAMPFMTVVNTVKGIGNMARGTLAVTTGGLQSIAGRAVGNDQMKKNGIAKLKAGGHMIGQGATASVRTAFSMTKESLINITTGLESESNFGDKQKAAEILLDKGKGKFKSNEKDPKNWGASKSTEKFVTKMRAHSGATTGSGITAPISTTGVSQQKNDQGRS